MTFQPGGIDHVEVFVRDLNASIAWYQRVLGLQLVHRFDPQPVMIGTDGSMLALFQADPAASGQAGEGASKAPHWHRVAWRTDAAGFAQAQDHLRACAIPFRGPVDHRIAESIYFHDPDGNPLEITHDLPESP